LGIGVNVSGSAMYSFMRAGTRVPC
jgi:hypothetical protein